MNWLCSHLKNKSGENVPQWIKTLNWFMQFQYTMTTWHAGRHINCSIGKWQKQSNIDGFTIMSKRLWDLGMSYSWQVITLLRIVHVNSLQILRDFTYSKVPFSHKTCFTRFKGWKFCSPLSFMKSFMQNENHCQDLSIPHRIWQKPLLIFNANLIITIPKPFSP